jgi:hypothetical protein
MTPYEAWSARTRLREKDEEICDLQRSLATALCAKGDADRALAGERVQRQRAQQRERDAQEEVRCLITIVTAACFRLPATTGMPDWDLAAACFRPRHHCSLPD